ncbi:unnamed protein product [Cladocopium goreaui]|uniref:Pentatricopeptide repeat-containing protein At5g42310, chloroplastic (Protein CRP1 homolog) (AtCRP1) n=1 Tax=Cladocopium goreaui TaxID=2562237 RepID=A0A9P1M297_9DINO|nr:unnamed protein product [Cladocopium goreaui]
MAVASRRADGGKWRASKQRRDGQDALRWTWLGDVDGIHLCGGQKEGLGEGAVPGRGHLGSQEVEKLSMALQLLFEGQQRRLGPNVIACNAAISACEKAARWPQAIALLQPDSEIQGWNGAISACSKAGAWSMALLLLSALEKLPARRDAVHFGLRIACEAPRSWQKAITSLVAMQEAALEPNVRNFSALLRGCKEATAWESGLELLQQMFAKGPAPDVLAVNTVIASNPPWVIAGGPRDLWKALLKPSLYSPEVIGPGLVGADAPENFDAAARRETIPLVVFRAGDFTHIGLAGEWPVVLSLVSQLRRGERVNMDDVTYVNALTAYGRSKRRDFVSELLQDLRHPSSQPSVSAFSAVVAAAHWAEALQLLEEIASRQLRPQRQDLNAVIGNAAEGTFGAPVL